MCSIHLAYNRKVNHVEYERAHGINFRRIPFSQIYYCTVVCVSLCIPFSFSCRRVQTIHTWMRTQLMCTLIIARKALCIYLIKAIPRATERGYIWKLCHAKWIGQLNTESIRRECFFGRAVYGFTIFRGLSADENEIKSIYVEWSINIVCGNTCGWRMNGSPSGKNKSMFGCWCLSYFWYGFGKTIMCIVNVLLNAIF